ncbi:MAG: hypothetical protein JO235_18045 [Chroococcidiopsidaceae cyanobacterium CP_BM_RX_35]|nr:hypothetical protein [Chroococcidiopsidaceae cyanobacterium CP_BM_RX_35]
MNHLNIATSALYLLAEPATPIEAVKEALDRAALGEAISHTKSKEIIAQRKARIINDSLGTVRQQSFTLVELSSAPELSICPKPLDKSAPEVEGEKGLLKPWLPENFTAAMAEVQSTPNNCIQVLSVEWRNFEQSEESLQIFEIVSDLVHAKVACFPSTIVAILQHLSSHPLAKVADFLESSLENQTA